MPIQIPSVPLQDTKNNDKKREIECVCCSFGSSQGQNYSYSLWGDIEDPKQRATARYDLSRQSSPTTLHPTPYTLHSTPYALHHTLYTLHPTPYALRPTPYTIRPTPHTIHHAP